MCSIQYRHFQGVEVKLRKGSNILLCAGVLAGFSLPCLTNAGEFERDIEYRQAVMTIFAWNTKPMGAMLKGKQPFEAESFSQHAKDLEAAASLDLLAGFPEDSDAGETDALADIWLNFDDFKQKFANLRKASDELNKAASGSDQAAIKTAFGEVGKACKACHRAYKN